MVISCGTPAVVSEVLAGIEEEGVPSVVECRGDDQDAHALARLAAQLSTLEVGVGIDVHGRVSVAHQKLTEATDGLFSGPGAPAEVARALGHNAARIVVGIPLRAVAP
ncbi:glycerol dehydratase reactivase beta/small subunit family protein [Mycolicibacterium canariasense]|nr:glycerol dehydratase reactivase beta/small subunit family protein [Mycolicibacterium canariasense]ORV11134.1 hypothetical protein AWB94_06250 [Mycolicibacterium canariasense]